MKWTGWLCEGGTCARAKSATRPVPCRECAGYRAAVAS